MSEQFPETPSDPQTDAVDDPDLQAADSSLEEPDDPDDLSTDTLQPDGEDDVWEPDQHLSAATAELIASDHPDHETLDERLAQEVPDVDADRGGAADSDREVREV
jgi:hypothetical protein